MLAHADRLVAAVAPRAVRAAAEAAHPATSGFAPIALPEGPFAHGALASVPALAPTVLLPRGARLADVAPLPSALEGVSMPSTSSDSPARTAAASRHPVDHAPAGGRAPLVAIAVGGWANAVAALGAAFLLAACNGPRVVHENPVLVTGQRVPMAEDAAAAASAQVAERQRAARESRDSIAADAARGCAPAVCAALARGEVSLGMTESQVLAATRTTPAAWSARRSGGATVLTAASAQGAPSDVVGEVAMVQLAEGRVASVAYREPQGIRLVQRPQDATLDGRARATAEALVREGDAFNAAGDRAAALDRYDRALVLLPNDAMLQYRVATLLDLQLRPVEALIRYQRFLQSLEIQRIEAVGRANAQLADAIARAQQRIIVLERQGR